MTSKGRRSVEAEKFHVALSFAGEDRGYVDAVAKKLQQEGVRVFYDKFEETNLWGKDLYSYFSDIYRNRALYTVIFISRAYAKKLWTKHERQAAQARAFSENKEYILPATFDESVKIPGILKTTGYVKLSSLTPEEFAEKILTKLRADRVYLTSQEKFTYSSDAKADVDFSPSEAGKTKTIIKRLKSHDWYEQNPAIQKALDLDWTDITSDQAFVLGRNVYQAACGGAHKAEGVMQDLRRELAKIPLDVAVHLLNGMFYEVYFNSKGEFRGNNLKARFVKELFALQTVDKYKETIRFIRYALAPYQQSVAILPNTSPEIIKIKLMVAKKDPPLVQSIKFMGKELLGETDAEFLGPNLWKLSLKGFTLDVLRDAIAEAWHVPPEQIRVEVDPELPATSQLRLPKEKTILQPFN